MIECVKLNKSKIEVQVLSVLCDMGGQPLHEKGKIAEDDLSCPGKGFWDAAEYAVYCHTGVEGYH